MKKTIDLHIHSNLSDGELSPKEIIDRAVDNGVSVMAIADHDTTLAYSDELFNYAKEKNIKLITAVEISTKYNGIDRVDDKTRVVDINKKRVKVNNNIKNAG